MQRDEKLALKNLLRIRESETQRIKDKIARGEMEPVTDEKLKLMVKKLSDHKAQHKENSHSDGDGDDEECAHEHDIIHNLEHHGDESEDDIGHHSHGDDKGHSDHDVTMKKKDSHEISYK